MLKKVSSAISKYISPIASSGKAESSITNDKPKAREFKRFKVITNEDHPENKRNQQEESHPQADQPDNVSDINEAKVDDKHEDTSPLQGLGHRFINLLSKIQSKQREINRNKGKREYIEAEQKKQKKIKVKKGAMLNENVE